MAGPTGPKAKQAPLGNRGGRQAKLTRQAAAVGKKAPTTKIIPAKRGR